MFCRLLAAGVAGSECRARSWLAPVSAATADAVARMDANRIDSSRIGASRGDGRGAGRTDASRGGDAVLASGNGTA